MVSVNNNVLVLSLRKPSNKLSEAETSHVDDDCGFLWGEVLSREEETVKYIIDTRYLT